MLIELGAFAVAAQYCSAVEPIIPSMVQYWWAQR
jgi:hypothetical protein